MGACTDKSVTHLRKFGFNVVRVPIEDLHPLHVIGRQKDSVGVVGTIDQILRSPGELPKYATGGAANVNGENSDKLDLGIGLKILSGLLSGLGAGTLGVSTGFTTARKVTFEYKNVTREHIGALTVSQFLRGGQVDDGSPLLDQYILGRGKLFCVTEVLRSSELTAHFEKSAGVKASVDVPIIQNAVGGNVTVDASQAANGTVTFKGATALAFGFKCHQIGVKDGVLTMMGAPDGSTYLEVTADDAAGELLTDDGVLDFD